MPRRSRRRISAVGGGAGVGSGRQRAVEGGTNGSEVVEGDTRWEIGGGAFESLTLSPARPLLGSTISSNLRLRVRECQAVALGISEHHIIHVEQQIKQGGILMSMRPTCIPLRVFALDLHRNRAEA